MHYAVFSRYQHPKAHGIDSMSTIIVRFREDVESDLADVIKYLNWNGEGLPEPYTHTEQMYGGKGWALVAVFETPPTHLGYKQIKIDDDTDEFELTIYQHTLGDHRFVGIYDSCQIVPMYFFQEKEYRKDKTFIQYECECLCHAPNSMICHIAPCCAKCEYCHKDFTQITEHKRVCESAAKEQRDANEAKYQELIEIHRLTTILEYDCCKCNCHAPGIDKNWNGCTDCCNTCGICFGHIKKDKFAEHEQKCRLLKQSGKLNLDECKCACHKAPIMKHVTPCCLKCANCEKMVKADRIPIHAISCRMDAPPQKTFRIIYPNLDSHDGESKDR